MKRLLKWATLAGAIALAFKVGQGNGLQEAVERLTSVDPEAGAKLRSLFSSPVIRQEELDKAEIRRRTNP